ncbi:MAG: type 1 glutamine amidotransferase [Planctomycetota bacterium]|nr:MAG: type 1 glutamine amidotransferase [Planctomycetota bacterium]
MEIRFLQHVPFEGPAQIADWAAEQGHRIAVTRLDLGAPPPEIDTFDWLIVLGGPMNIYEEARYPFLGPEKACIRRAIDAGKAVLGLCLGAQLAADILGGRVVRNAHREIGWHPIESIDTAGTPLAGLPSPVTAFHWHGDMFEPPPKARLLARSEACPHQAFLYGDRVLGLQFHLEYDRPTIRAMLHHCADELAPGPYVQTAEAIERQADHVETLRPYLFDILDRLAAAAR